MKKILILLYTSITLILAIATFVEAKYGTEFIKNICYGSSWFFALWAVIGIWGIIYLFKRKIWNRPAALLLHTAFIVILVGAGITWIFGEQGMMHIREGETSHTFITTNDTTVRNLPFEVKLNKFSISYYQGTNAPANYASTISIIENNNIVAESDVSMNNIFSHHGYRFYQSSYDEDGHGSWLSINHDPIGIGITYTGYILMAIAMLFVLCSKKCGFRKLLKNPLLQKATFCIVACIALNTNTFAQETERIKPIWPRESADSARSRQIIYNDRIAPFNTLARDFTLKLYGKPSYKGLTAEQVVGSWLLFPDVWSKEAMIQIKSDDLREKIGVKGKYARYIDFFDENGQYKLALLWQELQADTNKTQPSSLEKAISQANEKVALITMLQQHTLIRPLPNNITPVSNAKIQAELLYNQIPFCKILFMANLTFGFIALFLLIYKLVRLNNITFSKATTILKIFLLISFIFHSIGMGLHWYVSGRIPLGNGYETMMFVAWCILLIANVLQKKISYFIPFGFLLSGFALLVAYLGQKNPQITQLMPVLHSPLLSIHVSILMMAYALYGFVTLNGIVAIFLHLKSKEQYAEQISALTILNKVLLYPATFFMGCGIFIGAVWANISWGTYWSWDPKETWALITFLVYASTFHTESVEKFNKPIFFHTFIVIAFLTVLMTYFGVNNLLGGMHSYK